MMKKLTQRFIQRSQSGQSLVILAIGFVALLGFVGIVTDVSLMFVRFNTLTRAVDAASIAAAGQVRRQVPFQSEINDHCSGLDPDGNAWTPGNPCPEAEAAAFARSFGNVGVAARQFIEFYGLDPQAVVIDMCFTVSQLNAAGDELEAIPGLEEEFTELCQGPQGRNNERKLIKLTAQIDSPTVFMRLLGFPDITLQASSISETAVLDVVLIVDVSESMLLETEYSTWAEEGYKEVYLPPDVGWSNYWDGNGATPGAGFGAGRRDSDGNLDEHNFANITGFRDYDGMPGGEPWFHFRADLTNLQNNPAIEQPDQLLWPTGNVERDEATEFLRVETERLPGFTGGTTLDLRSECKVAYWPNTFNDKPSTYLNDLYDDVFGDPWMGYEGFWQGFVPTYNFYGCCNDPDGDGLFNDLLCEPFRSARLATEQFIKRIDFLRGDRIAFVTFDRQAFLVNVEVDADTGTWSHMIDEEQLAIRTLQESIGVRAEPSFYEPIDLPGDRGGVPWTGPSSLLSDMHDYPVYNNCPFQNAALEWPYSPVSSPSSADAAAFGLTYFSNRSPNLLTPDNFASGGAGTGGPDAQGQRMYPRGPSFEGAAGYGAQRSYDLWASCRGTNVGAALRAGGNALLDPVTTRTNGAVWVMVLLGDGAAGASDPVFDSTNGLVTQPDDLSYPYNNLNFRVKYGGLGLCPAGARAGDTELSEFNESPRYQFPYCSDEIPETRNFCFNPQLEETIAGERVRLYVDIGQCGSNLSLYDVDDYARDWADWIGLADPPGASATAQRNLTQLPTIFSIGFGLNFDSTTRCRAGQIATGEEGFCLGEELLRYIADVGDNFQVDSDYQQYLVNQRYDPGNSLSNEDFGPRGECEEDLDNPASATFTDLVQPLQAGRSCGNYYNAPAADELERVFDDIASRMFTRLTA